MRVFISLLLACLLTACVSSGILGGFPLERMRDSSVAVTISDGHGSGVIISPNYLITANHVALEGPDFTIIYSDGSIAKAHVVKEWPEFDVALLKFTDGPTTHAVSPLACRAPVWGELVAGVGNALELHNNIVTGVVSSTDEMTYKTTDPLVKVLVPLDINFMAGMSGGPVFDREGNVLGTVDATLLMVSFNNPLNMPMALPAGVGLMIPSWVFCDSVKKEIGS